MRKILSFVLVFFMLMNLVIPAVAKEEPVQSQSSDTGKMQRFLYYYKSKEPFRAIVYSMIIPGLGNIYCEDIKNALVSWLIIGCAIAASGTMPNDTDQQVSQKASVFTSGFFIGYLYSIVTAYTGAVKFNNNLKANLNTRVIKTNLWVVHSNNKCAGLGMNFWMEF